MYDEPPSLPLGGPESPVEQRIDEIGRHVFERAVSQAAEIATQNVAQVHRRRLVTQSFLAALACSALIGIILAFVFKTQADSNAHHNSVTNCQLVQRLEAPLSDFVTSDAKLREAQAKVTPDVQRALQRLLDRKTLTKAEQKSAQTAASITGYWNTSVVPRLDRIAGADCLQLLH